VALNGLPDQLLADRVAPGGINVVDAAGPDRLQQRGSLMGVLGMLIFVPLVSVLYALFRENVYKNLRKKEITDEMLKE